MSLIIPILKMLNKKRDITLKDGKKYYNTELIVEELERLNDLDLIKIFMIIGKRRIGKTDYFMELAILNYFINGKKTFWLRNFDVELKEPEFYSNFLNDAFALNMIPENTNSDKIKIDKRGVSYEEDLFIQFQSINTYSNMRGANHPNCNLMILDEFIGEKRKYPKSCVQGLLSLTKTIFSGREDCFVFCLSNFVSVTNAYFVGFSIYPEKQKAITTFADKGIMIERCQDTYRCAIIKESKWNNIYKAGNYGDYESEDEDDLNNFIAKLPKESEPHDYVIHSNNNFYRVYYSAKKSCYYWKKDNVRHKDDIYVYDYLKMNGETKMIPKDVIDFIKITFEVNSVKFDSANTLFSILDIMYNV